MSSQTQDWKKNRVIKFFPVDNESPKALTREQVFHYNKMGCVKPLDVYSGPEAVANREYFDHLLEEAQKNGLNSYSINGYHTHWAGVWDIATNSIILDYVEDILGPDFVCWGTHYMCKLPNDPHAVPWHQDASYWPLSPSKTVTAWLAIDDADRGNSAMKVVSGSHLHGHLEFSLSKPGEKVILDQKVTNAELYGDVEYFELKAGQMSLHSDLLVHGSDPNPSDRRRCGLTLCYASVDVRALTTWNDKSIWCRGQDPENHWFNIPRPECE